MKHLCDPSINCCGKDELEKQRIRRINNPHSEAEIQREILVAFGARSDLRIWRANTGKAFNPSGRLVTFGVPGQPDIMGLRLPHGQLIGIEVKSATGKQRADQASFQAMMERFGGLYILARSVADVECVLGKSP